jgi:tetratricopeptide (TPR) repeat protein
VSEASGIPSAVEGLLERALARAEQGEWDGAAGLLREGLEDHPDDPYLLCWLGTAERELGLEGAAYELFRRVLALSPRDPVLLATAGSAVAAFDDPAAEAALRTAALLAPDLARTRLRYGAYLAREGVLEEALRELDAATDLAPDDPLVHLEHGVAHVLGGDMVAGERCFGQAVELDPGDGWGLILLGLTRLELGELDEAAGVLEQGARNRPEDVEAQLMAALAVAASGLGHDRAEEMLERARLQAGRGDMGLIGEVERGIDDGPEAARILLSESLAPSSLRERLSQRAW